MNEEKEKAAKATKAAEEIVFLFFKYHGRQKYGTFWNKRRSRDCK